MSPHRRLPSIIGLEILLASPHQSDHDSLAGILRDFKCGLHSYHTRREAVSFLRDHSLGVVIADTGLPDGTWKDLLNDVLLFSNAPNVIVTSRLADERLWAEVLNMGGYDLLMTPYDSHEVVRVTALAWLDWERKRALGFRKSTGASRDSLDLAKKAAVDIPRYAAGESRR